jgi:hypothetical protein
MSDILDRIQQIRADADAFLDEKAKALSEKTPGVPLQVLRNMLTNRAYGCQCRAVLNNIDGRPERRTHRVI